LKKEEAVEGAETFRVHRARPSDAEAIADFVSRATHGRVSVSRQSVLERFGVKGMVLAWDTNEQVVGLAGWRAENLIARIDDFLVFPPELYLTAGRQLIEDVEQAAQELQCEVSMFFVPPRASSGLLAFYKSCGYGPPGELDGLPRTWKQTVQEAEEQGRHVMLKQLRQDLVLRPM
jgi:N-acetylglutamate synthase-like GNAT family acetyltransferase